MSLRRHKKIRNDPNFTLAKSHTRVSYVNVHGSIENPGWGPVVRKGFESLLVRHSSCWGSSSLNKYLSYDPRGPALAIP